jgi:DNA repair photolyase
MKKRCGIVKTYDEWCKPKIVANALELLNNEINKYKNRIDNVHLCFSTDPFMYRQSAIKNLSLKIIGKLNENNIRCTVLTKGLFPADFTDRSIYSNKNEYGITLVSLDEKFRKEYEPNTAPFVDRIAALRYLHNKGLKTWVSIEPYPTPNIIQQDLLKILKAVSFADKIVFGRLNYSTKSSSFKYHRQFYKSCAQLVVKFCRRSNIRNHIKKGTLRS